MLARANQLLICRRIFNFGVVRPYSHLFCAPRLPLGQSGRPNLAIGDGQRIFNFGVVRPFSRLFCPPRLSLGQSGRPNLATGDGIFNFGVVRPFSHLFCPPRLPLGQSGRPNLATGDGQRIFNFEVVRPFSRLFCPPRLPLGQSGRHNLATGDGRRIFNFGVRTYSLCCPPRPPPGQCGCPNPVPGGGRRIVPPSNCRPGPIPPNPCVPVFHHGKDTWKKYKYITFFVCIPLIITQAFHALGHEPPPKGECRDYEYMRTRTKRFPWGDGVESFFHNEHVNHLPGECVMPPLDCD